MGALKWKMMYCKSCVAWLVRWCERCCWKSNSLLWSRVAFSHWLCTSHCAEVFSFLVDLAFWKAAVVFTFHFLCWFLNQWHALAMMTVIFLSVLSLYSTIVYFHLQFLIALLMGFIIINACICVLIARLAFMITGFLSLIIRVTSTKQPILYLTTYLFIQKKMRYK
jgi:hypothetical protein